MSCPSPFGVLTESAEKNFSVTQQYIYAHDEEVGC